VIQVENQGGATVPYSELLVRPMREELSTIGVRELRTPGDVDAFLNEKNGTAMLVVNSVCGCAAGMARPGVRLALEGERRPDRVASVFAGQDLDAPPALAPSWRTFRPAARPSPSSRTGELVYFMPRHRIEGRNANQVASDLTQVFAEFCAVPAAT